MKKKKTPTKQTVHSFTIDGQRAMMTVMNKKGKEMVVTFDSKYLDLVKQHAPYFAQWQQEYNNFLILTEKKVENHHKELHHKIPLATILLNVESSTPILYADSDTLNLMTDNLEVFDRNEPNTYVLTEEDTALIPLKNKFGHVVASAIIDATDVSNVITDKMTWTIQKRIKGQPKVVANTVEGRVILANHLLNPASDEYIRFINKNPLDNRRENLKVEKIETEQIENSLE